MRSNFFLYLFRKFQKNYIFRSQNWLLLQQVDSFLLSILFLQVGGLTWSLGKDTYLNLAGCGQIILHLCHSWSNCISLSSFLTACMKFQNYTSKELKKKNILEKLCIALHHFYWYICHIS